MNGANKQVWGFKKDRNKLRNINDSPQLSAAFAASLNACDIIE
jgi:hypothetical protein